MTIEKVVAYKDEAYVVFSLTGYWGTAYCYRTSTGAAGSMLGTEAEAERGAERAIDKLLMEVLHVRNNG